MGGGRLRHPPLINYQFYIKKLKRYTETHMCGCSITLLPGQEVGSLFYMGSIIEVRILPQACFRRTRVLVTRILKKIVQILVTRIRSKIDRILVTRIFKTIMRIQKLEGNHANPGYQDLL